MAMTKIKGLQMWCRKMTEGYPHVDVANFTTAWRDGMAFCAIIHRFRPDLIDYDSLSPQNVYENCKMAFDIAERELNIPAFLEAEDMARLKVPDKLSVITYVSQYYNFLNALPQLGGPGVKATVSTKPVSGTKRPLDKDTSQAPSIKKPTPKAAKENAEPASDKTRQSSMGDKCDICQNRVFLLERHIEGGKLYHRSCYRHSELSPTNKVFTRSPFLSPSLSSEPLSPSHTSTDKKSNVLAELERERKGDAHNKQEKAKPLSPVSKRTEGTGMKHPLVEPDREDTKKSKMQPKTLFNDEKAKKASAIKDRLENLKAAYTEDKKKEPEKTLPFSSKEARKLEKRREEILASEKSAGDTKRGAKRHVPLIFQQQDKTVSDPVKSVSSVSSSITAKTSSHTTATSIFSTSSVISTSSTSVTSKCPNAPLTTSSASKATASHSDSGPAFTNIKLKSVQDQQKPAEDKKLDSILKKKSNLPDVQNLQKMFSDKSDSSGAGKQAQTTSQPVAKPRSSAHKLGGGDSSKNNSQAETVGAPKAAPRKSVLTSGEKKAAPDRPPQSSSAKKSSLLSDSSGDESSRSLGSPPPLPRSAPPPLPTSMPPPLPASDPVGHIKPPSSDVKQSAAKIVQEIKTAKKNTEDVKPDSASSKKGGDSHLSNNYEKHSHSESASKITTHSPVKSKVAGNTAAMAESTTTKTASRRWSSPVSMEKEPLAVFVVPKEKQGEGEVLSGLLASLAGVRGRAASSPNSSGVTFPPVSPPTVVPSSQTSSSFTSTTSEASKTTVASTVTVSHTKAHISTDSTKVSVSEPSSDRSVTSSKLKDTNVSKDQSTVIPSPTSSDIPEALSVLSSLKHVESTIPPKSSTVTTKTDIKLTKPQTLDNDSQPTVLTSKDNDSAVSVGKRENQQISLGNKSQENLINLPRTEVKLDVAHRKHDGKGSASSPTPTKRHSLFHDQPKPLTSLDKKLSKSTEQLEQVKLKRVMPEPKTTTKESKSKAFDVKLKKVEAIKGDEKWSGTSQKTAKPPSLPHTSSAETPKAASKTVNGKVEDKKLEAVTPDLSSLSSKDSKKEITSVSTSGNALANKTAANTTTKTNDDMPQWKKDIEERRKKLREDMAKADSNTANLKLKAQDTKKTSLRPSTPEPVKRSKSPARTTGESKSVTSTKTEQNKSSDSLTVTDKESSRVPEWQREAEKKMAELAGSLSDDEKPQETTKTKRTLPRTPAESPAPVPHKQQSDPEFMVTKTKLKPVDIDIDISKDEKEEIQLHNKHGEENGKTEDFRDKLHHLKHVGLVEPQSGTPDLGVKTSADTETPRSHLTKSPALDKNANQNNNKLLSPTENKQQLKVSDLEHIQKLTQAGPAGLQTISLASSSDEEKDNRNHLGVTTQEKTTNGVDEIKGDKQALPKVKRKITVIGNNKKENKESSPPSPSPRKKIPVTKEFNFEESSEVEISLSDSTAKLTIRDKHTPPPRPPPPHPQHKMKSPGHISAIELQQQLLDIDSRLTDLELRGRDLEVSIRNVNTLEDDDDDLMMEWFKLVSEKNELVRKEADLVYLSREQELESEQEQIESQLRYLISKPDESKSPIEKQEEDYLIYRKIELVEQRNKIVDSMDEDRLRYEKEDRDIEVTLKDKGLWKDNGTMRAMKGKKVAKSKFYT